MLSRKLACFALAASCLVHPAKAQTPSHQRATLKFRLKTDPITLDWNRAHTSHETYILMNIMEGLVKPGPDHQPQPALAESWKVSPDGKTYTFKIRKNVLWSDGNLLEARHFVASWRRLLDPKTKAKYASLLYSIKNARDYHLGVLKDFGRVGVRSKDPHTLIVELESPAPHFIHIPTFWATFPVRRDINKTLGPYQLVSWKRGKQITLKKNPSYYGYGYGYRKSAENSPEKVEIFIEEDDKRSREFFKEGKIDFLLNATTEDLLLFSDDSFKKVHFPYFATYYLGFNILQKPIQNLSLREAIVQSIPKDEIPGLLQSAQTPAGGWIPPGIEGHHKDVSKPVHLFKARASLSKAGYPEGRGLRKLKLTLEKFDGSQKLGEFLKKKLFDHLGVDIQITYGNPFDRSSDLFVRHWGADFPDPSNFFRVFTSSSGTNYTGWKNKNYDSLIEKAEKTMGLKNRIKIYHQAETLLLKKETVIFPLFYQRNSVVLGPRIKNFKMSPLNYLFFSEITLRNHTKEN